MISNFFFRGSHMTWVGLAEAPSLMLFGYPQIRQVFCDCQWLCDLGEGTSDVSVRMCVSQPNFFRTNVEEGQDLNGF